MGKMSREDLFREIGEIDEIYIEEAQKVRRKRRISPWVGRTLVTAASLFICVGVGYAALSLMQGGTDSTDGTSGNAMEAAQELYSMAEADDQMTAGAASEAMSEDSAPQAENQAQDTGQAEELQDIGVRDENDKEMQSVDSMQDFKEGVEEPREPGEDAAQNSEMDSGMLQGALTESVSVTTEKTQLVWEAARMDADYGRYVDVQVPEGYSYTSGIRSESGLHVIWSKGMEEISISCRQADESVSDCLVDTDTPEQYDLGMYAIPWADSVPEEMIQKVSNATFYADQITREIVIARSYQVQEQEDVSGWRTRIAILYSDNVLVEIHSKGPSPEEIYGLINLEN